MTGRAAWVYVGRLADVLQILTVIGGLAFVAFAVAGVDVLADPSDQTLLLAAIVLGASSLLAVLAGVVRAQAPASGFEENGRATNRMLYVTAAVLFALAVVALALLVYRDPPAQPLCWS